MPTMLELIPYKYLASSAHPVTFLHHDQTFTCSGDTISNAFQTTSSLRAPVNSCLVYPQGGYAGNAAGIKLSSLQTLMNVRANKPGMTLMHSIAEQAARRHPETLTFPEELEELELASKSTTEQIKTDIDQLDASVKKARKGSGGAVVARPH